MGEIADMMIEGDLCAGCGAFIDEGGGDGFPRYCSKQCAKDCGAAYALGPNNQVLRDYTAPPTQKVKCPTCQRRVKITGLADHQRDAHGLKA